MTLVGTPAEARAGIQREWEAGWELPFGRDGGSLAEAEGQRNRASVALGSPGQCALRRAFRNAP
jgi:hypothetical protein